MSGEIDTSLVASQLRQAGYDSPAFHTAISTYLSEMLRWNAKHNLTAITNPQEMVSKHIIDSLTIAEALQGEQILDVGSGAGLPGIPLALHCPDQQFTLLDALSKRCFFLQHIVGTLQLPNVSVVHSRIEDFANQPAPAHFSTITCRAFTSLRGFVSSVWSLLADSGIILAMKGDYPGAEMDDLTSWIKQANAPLVIADVQPLQVTGLSASRHLVTIRRDLA